MLDQLHDGDFSFHLIGWRRESNVSVLSCAGDSIESSYDAVNETHFLQDGFAEFFAIDDLDGNFLASDAVNSQFDEALCC